MINPPGGIPPNSSDNEVLHADPQGDSSIQPLIDEIRQKHGEALQAILVYGSWLRGKRDTMLDFYVLVEDYRTLDSAWQGFMCRLLPPNVYHIHHKNEDPGSERPELRAKYALLTLDRFRKAMLHDFHSYFWARFAQPFSYLFLRNDQDKNWLVHIQESAITTFHNNVSGSFNNTVDSQEFWVKGFELTYLSELRAESENRADSIYKANASFYDEVFKKLPVIGNHRSGNLFVWKLRMALGKLLSLMRLLKATTTFTNGVDYIAWKIERHTGEKIDVTDRLRKYPWLFIWPVLIRLIRNKSVR